MVTLDAKDQHISVAEREVFIAATRACLPARSIYLQTCNRVEVYAGEGTVPRSIAEHLFRVAAGLESTLLGETAVLGQVKQAYQLAAQGPLPKSLHCLFQTALKVGKRVRHETKLARGAVGHGQAALQLIEREVPELSQAQVVILGVNHLNRTIVKYLVERAGCAVFLANRSLDKALALSQELGCRAFHLAALAVYLRQADVLVTATSAPHAIVRCEHVPVDRKLVIVDLAVPRDVEAGVGTMPKVKLFNLEDVERIALAGRKLRTEEVEHAQLIVDQEVEGFIHAQAQHV